MRDAPYPGHLTELHRLRDGRVVRIRPVRADDAPGVRRLFESLSDETRRLRFHRDAPPISDSLVRFHTEIDYAQHMALACEVAEDGGPIVGDARYVTHPAGAGAEFAVVVADDWRRTGIAPLLMAALERAAREGGVRSLEGLVLRENEAMLGFVRKLGFQVSDVPEDERSVRVVKKL